MFYPIPKVRERMDVEYADEWERGERRSRKEGATKARERMDVESADGWERGERRSRKEGATKAPLLAQVKLNYVFHHRRERSDIAGVVAPTTTENYSKIQLNINWFYLFSLAAGKGHQLNTHLLVNQHEDVTKLRVSQKKKPKSPSGGASASGNPMGAWRSRHGHVCNEEECRVDAARTLPNLSANEVLCEWCALRFWWSGNLLTYIACLERTTATTVNSNRSR
jgi:hypothetical protein